VLPIRALRPAALAGAALLALTACSHSADPSSAPATVADSAAPAGWPTVLQAARGQQVNWYMYGGDEVLNTFVTGELSQRLKRYGVTVNEVKLTDTADAVNKLLAEKQAGRGKGSIDLVWVNGENFATGKQAGLWKCGYDRALPNATHVDFTDPAISSDFGTLVQGCETPWQQADSALVYDSSKFAATDVASVTALSAWAKAHPGRFTYPAPPDFTGSMAVRTFLYDTAGGRAALRNDPNAPAFSEATGRLWDRLSTLAPSLWRKGKTYPSTQDQTEKLYANGEIDAFFTYGPGATSDKVRTGTFPDSTREAVLGVGNIANTSFVAIPANAPHAAAAQILANELLDPAVQLALFKANGSYPAIDLDKLPPAQRQQFASVNLGPSVLPLAELAAHTLPELPAAAISRVEDGWKTHVLQR